MDIKEVFVKIKQTYAQHLIEENHNFDKHFEFLHHETDVNNSPLLNIFS